MKEETDSELNTRREKVVKYAKVNCAVSCLVLVLNIMFVIGAVVYILNVRAQATQAVMQLNLLQDELDNVRLTVDRTTRFVFNTSAPKNELFRRRLDQSFDEAEDE